MIILKLITTLLYAYSAGIRYDVEFSSYEDYMSSVENNKES